MYNSSDCVPWYESPNYVPCIKLIYMITVRIPKWVPFSGYLHIMTVKSKNDRRYILRKDNKVILHNENNNGKKVQLDDCSIQLQVSFERGIDSLYFN